MGAGRVLAGLRVRALLAWADGLGSIFCSSPPLSWPQPNSTLLHARHLNADPDSKPGALVLNRTCTLKESFPKQTAAKGAAKGK